MKLLSSRKFKGLHQELQIQENPATTENYGKKLANQSKCLRSSKLIRVQDHIFLYKSNHQP